MLSADVESLTGETENKNKRSRFMAYLPWGLSLIFLIAFILALAIPRESKECPAATAPGIDPENILPLNGQTYSDRIEGARPYLNQVNHLNSKYYPQIDFYNAKSEGTLKIIEKVKTSFQTSEYDDIPILTQVILEYYNKDTSRKEEDLIELFDIGTDERKNKYGNDTQGNLVGSPPDDIAEGFEKLGFSVDTKADHPNLEMGNSETDFRDWLLDCVNKKDFLLLSTGDWGAHWQMVIGVDTMGTEETADDVVITVDTYDTTDHRMDGYNIWSLERLFSLWQAPSPVYERYNIIKNDTEFHLCQFIRVKNPKNK